MNDNFSPPIDDDLWAIPLHGASVPEPASVIDEPTASSPPIPFPNHPTVDDDFGMRSDDVPTDIGFQPRLRRSA